MWWGWRKSSGGFGERRGTVVGDNGVMADSCSKRRFGKGFFWWRRAVDDDGGRWKEGSGGGFCWGRRRVLPFSSFFVFSLFYFFRAVIFLRKKESGFLFWQWRWGHPPLIPFLISSYSVRRERREWIGIWTEPLIMGHVVPAARSEKNPKQISISFQ